MSIKITTWNINSARLRIDTICHFLKSVNPDVLCLQEIKCLREQFPEAPLRELGYDYIEINGQKAYHGAATISRLPLTRLDTKFCPKGEARHVSTHVAAGPGLELHNFYVPAGGDIADAKENPKFAHKLDFLDTMTTYFKSRSQGEDAGHVIVGDLNIAPHENDVWSHKQLLKVVSHTPLEVDKLETLRQAHDFTDCSRLFADDADKLYSWWSYRAKDVFKSNRGRRLDHIWVSPKLRPFVESSGPNGHTIHTDYRIMEKPSDHAPMTQLFKF
jgi:exodeoxyribonuclease-3